MPKKIEKEEKDSLGNKRFIAALKKWMQNNNLKQNAAAGILGLTPSTFGNIIRGDKGISFTLMDSIAEKLKRDVVELLIEGKSILEGQPHEANVDTAEPPTIYGTDLSDIKDILKTIATATLGQIEMTKQADIDIIKAIKQNKIEEYENLLERRDAYIVKLQEDIEELKAEVDRLQTKVANKLLVLVPDKNGDSCAA